MLFTLEVRVTGIWNLAKLLRKLIDVQFLRFSGSGVSRSCIAFGVLAGRLCFVREVALFKLEKKYFRVKFRFINAFTKCVRLRRHMDKFSVVLFTRLLQETNAALR